MRRRSGLRHGADLATIGQRQSPGWQPYATCEALYACQTHPENEWRAQISQIASPKEGLTMRGGHKAHSGLIPTLRYTSEPLSDPSHLKAFVRAKKSPASGGGRGKVRCCRVRPQAPAVFGFRQSSSAGPLASLANRWPLPVCQLRISARICWRNSSIGTCLPSRLMLQ